MSTIISGNSSESFLGKKYQPKTRPARSGPRTSVALSFSCSTKLWASWTVATAT